MAKALEALEDAPLERPTVRFSEIRPGEGYAFKRFRLVIASGVLTRDGEPVSLAPTAFGTLVVLVRRAGQTVTKDELMAAVWPRSFVSEESVTQCVYALRRALGDDPAHPRYIATLSKRGYRFVAPVAHLSSESHGASAADSPHQAQASVSRNPSNVEPATTQPRRMLLFGLVVLVAIGAAVLWRFHPSPPDAIPRLLLTANPPPGTHYASGAQLSPDGHQLVIVATDDRTGKTQLWVNTLESGSFRSLPGTEGAIRPFWSPDNRSVGFFSDGLLKTIGLDADAPRPLTHAGTTITGGTWSARGVIAWSEIWSGLFSIPEGGGDPVALTALDATYKENGHRWPQFLPDGRHYIYFVASPDPQRAGTYLASLDSHDRVRLLDGQSSAASYAPSGHLLFVHDGVLTAQALDLKTAALTGPPISIAGDVSGAAITEGATISASAGGLLAFERGEATRRLSWFTTAGEKLSTLDLSPPLNNPLISADETQAVASSQGRTAGVWLIDLKRGSATRLTMGSGPLFAPDGNVIAYTSRQAGGPLDIYTMPIAGPPPDRPLLHTAENKLLQDWSSDGKYIVYVSTNSETKQDLWALPMGGSESAFPVVRTGAAEIQGRLSPNGRWMAYASDESGSWEVYVTSFPKSAYKRTVSIGGGSEPQWQHDGKGLYYLRSDNMLMWVALDAGDPAPQPGLPRALFLLPVSGNASVSRGFYRNHFVVTSDNRRVLVAADEDAGPPVSIMVGWNAALRNR